jgi:hypothetical protein
MSSGGIKSFILEFCYPKGPHFKITKNSSKVIHEEYAINAWKSIYLEVIDVSSFLKVSLGDIEQ